MKNQKGITLIALVITIIVLLILAGVSIAMLSGENGLLNKASEVTSKSSEGNLEEATKLAIAQVLLENNGTITGKLVAGEPSVSNSFSGKILAQNPDLAYVIATEMSGTNGAGDTLKYLKVESKASASASTVDATVFVTESGAVYKTESAIKTALGITA